MGSGFPNEGVGILSARTVVPHMHRRCQSPEGMAWRERYRSGRSTGKRVELLGTNERVAAGPIETGYAEARSTGVGWRVNATSSPLVLAVPSSGEGTLRRGRYAERGRLPCELLVLRRAEGGKCDGMGTTRLDSWDVQNTGNRPCASRMRQGEPRRSALFAVQSVSAARLRMADRLFEPARCGHEARLRTDDPTGSFVGRSKLPVQARAFGPLGPHDAASCSGTGNCEGLMQVERPAVRTWS